MRTFTQGSGSDRKFVTIELNGARVGVAEGTPGGATKRKEKELPSEDAARSALEKMARELIARGFVEQSAAAATKPKPAARAATAPVPHVSSAYDDIEAPAVTAAPVLPRMGTAAESAPKKKKKGAKKKRQKPQSGDTLDKRVLAVCALIGVALLGGAGFLVYDTFLKPPTLAGTWAGSRVEHEISRSLTYSKFRLLLDDQKRASMTLQENYTSSGTYTVKGDRLKLTLKDEEGDTTEHEYKIVLGHTTLDLFDAASGKKVVQLIRQGDAPKAAPTAPPPAPPQDIASGAADKVDKAADDRLASVEYAPKDGAFKVRHPPGWTPETGSRPDNTYSWTRFTKGSAKIQIFADVQGSLMSGSDVARDHEEGSESAPVHNAHELYKKKAAEEYSDYKESTPAVFKNAGLGEGRIATFTASTGGLMGTKLRGYRVTLLTNNRRVTILCECPERDIEKLKPTFLAVCRSVSN